MLIRTETSTNENGEKIKKEYYGYIDENGNEVITGTRKMPDTEMQIAEPIPLTEQEQIAIDTALNVEYIACLLESNMGL